MLESLVAQEERIETEKKRQLHLYIIVLLSIFIEAFAFIYSTLNSEDRVQIYLGTIIVIHISLAISTVQIFRSLIFEKTEGDLLETEMSETSTKYSEQEEDSKLDLDEDLDEISHRFYDSTSKDDSDIEIDEKPTESEIEALNLLKEQIAQLPGDQKGFEWIRNCGDLVYLRFLRGHLLRIPTAFKYLVKCGEWRHDYGIDTIIEEWESNISRSALLLKRSWPMKIIGEDDAGRKVILFRISMCDFPGFYRACSSEDITRHSVYGFEKNLIETKGRHSVLIIDLGYSAQDVNRPIESFGQVRTWIAGLMQYLGSLTKIFDPYYPETYHRIIFTRAPAPFWATWRVVQLLIAERTRAKIVILTGQYPKEKLLEHLPLKAIPDFLEGEASTADFPRGGLISSTKSQNIGANNL